MKSNDRIRAYAGQIGVDSAGAFKNGTSKKRLVTKLTPRQQRRVAKKELASAA
jgi:hypothetical protein